MTATARCIFLNGRLWLAMVPVVTLVQALIHMLKAKV
jgi:hypothetical protein